MTRFPSSKKLQAKRFSSLLNRGYSIITSKDDLTKLNARINQILKESRYQENIANNIFKVITNNPNLSQSKQQGQRYPKRNKYK